MTTRIVVPAYNEAERFDADAFLAYLDADPRMAWLLVDDGSADETARLLETTAERAPSRVAAMRLERNSGKAEAVRRGLLRALETECDVVGYFDADLATPVSALTEMRDALAANPAVDIVLASRVQLLGREIDRNPMRHYAGRVFATAASTLLAIPVYDTQCGAKLFRVNDALRDALAEPFVSRWVFDVELFRRLQIARAARGLSPFEAATIEHPLGTWTDVDGSKVRPADFPKALLELHRIHRRYGRG